MENFHFLRPLWFLALLPLAVLLVMVWRRHLASRSWQAVVDAQLLPYLLIGTTQQRRPWGVAALALGGVLAITALAGPTWSKLQTPLFRRDAALVVLLDLSQSMNATDVAPSRLQMARFKLRDLLAQRKEGETALVVYAANPFTVTPLSSDSDNITRQLGSLTPELMPAQGSRADRAIAQAQQLLQQAGASHGDVLLITDGIDNTPASPLRKAVHQLTAAGYRLSVLGVGTNEGAPIPLAEGGFLQDGGAIVVARLDESALQQLASDGGGIYRHLLAGNDNDISAFSDSFARVQNAQQAKEVSGMKSDQWREEGRWLLLPLLLLASLAFRRGVLLLLLLTLLMPLPRSAYALDWDGLWHNSEQRAARALDAHQPQQAAKMFKDPQWRAAAHYRAGDYQATLDTLNGESSAEADYNRGNALAQLGKFKEAVTAYDNALKKDPHNSDAQFNRELVKKWLQQQQAQGGNDKNKQQSHDSDKQQSQGSNDQGKQQGHGDKQQPSQQAQDQQQQSRAAQPQKGQSQPQQSGQPSSSMNTGQDTQQHQSSRQQSAQKENNAQRAPDNTQQSQQEVANAQQQNDKQPSSPRDATSTIPGDTQQEQSKQIQASEQWLRRIPDDPGGLWRRKFLYQYKRDRQMQQDEEKPW